MFQLPWAEQFRRVLDQTVTVEMTYGTVTGKVVDANYRKTVLNIGGGRFVIDYRKTIAITR